MHQQRQRVGENDEGNECISETKPKAIPIPYTIIIFPGKEKPASLSISLSLFHLVVFMDGFTNDYYIIKRRPFPSPCTQSPSSTFPSQPSLFPSPASKRNHSHLKICLHELFDYFYFFLKSFVSVKSFFLFLNLCC